MNRIRSGLRLRVNQLVPDLLDDVALNDLEIEKLHLVIALEAGATHLCLKQEALRVLPEQQQSRDGQLLILRQVQLAAMPVQPVSGHQSPTPVPTWRESGTSAPYRGRQGVMACSVAFSTF
ncbi:hypothetical protein SBV1_3360008 [Verrucomicrobia bacterium]|nr:hypothetical protein SBV1_3360008 [Verrucomicrobiota bacterium]